jgi:hypothetical protein
MGFRRRIDIIAPNFPTMATMVIGTNVLPPSQALGFAVRPQLAAEDSSLAGDDAAIRGGLAVARIVRVRPRLDVVARFDLQDSR